MVWNVKPYLIGLVLHNVIFGKGITDWMDMSTSTVFGFPKKVFTLMYIVDSVTPDTVSRTNNQISLPGRKDVMISNERVD